MKALDQVDTYECLDFTNRLFLKYILLTNLIEIFEIMLPWGVSQQILFLFNPDILTHICKFLFLST